MRRAALCLLPLVLAGCGDALCANRVTQRVLSPDGSREAVVYERDCGATTAYASHVVIGAPGLVPQGSSALFVATRGNMHRDWGNAEARVDWAGPDRLTITYDALSELFKQDESMDDVAVSYRQQGL